jgi:signal transduction histidine kinase
LVLFNLIENALDALGDAPGTIRVTGRVVAWREALEPERAWAEVVVADSGPGVPAENRERIFEPDFSTKHSLKKLGFGLWWVKTWLQRCGGSIVLAGPGGQAGEDADASPGAAFVIKLPVAKGGAP